MSLPEGVAFDGVTRRFFATGLFGNQITQIDAATGEEKLFHQVQHDLGQMSGAKVDERRRLLWVCASNIRGPAGGVHVFDVDTGELRHTFMLSTAGICNDVCVDADGVAYVTDSFQPVIYRVDLRDGNATEFVRDEQLAAPTGQFGLNGIAVTPDGERLIGGFTSPSKLFVVSLRGPDAVREVSLVGDQPAAHDPNFTGADGIVFIGDKLYIVHNGGVQEVSFTAPDYSEGRVRGALAPEAGLTTATVVDGELYVIKSEVVNVIHRRLPPNLPFKIYRFPAARFA
jgi:sugar lactone lactonase YvrE